MNGTLSSLLLSPVKRASGHVDLPGSKSISNRVLLLSALAAGSTRLNGLLDSDDTRVMIQALRQCGIQLNDSGSGQMTVQGANPFPLREAELFLGNAGTAIRPLTAALAVMGGDFTLSGVPRMHERPIGDLVDALQAIGARIEYLGTPGFPPLRLRPGHIAMDRPISVKADVSSQFLTAILLAAPIQAARQAADVVIRVEGELISKPYISITLKLMEQFGVTVQRDGWRQFTVAAGSSYVSPQQVNIEGDASSASYFMAMGALGGGPIRIAGAGADSIQGDIDFADVVEAMGADVSREPMAITIGSPGVASGFRLRAFDRDFNLIPDAAMTAAVMALFADGPCTLRNIASWRVKETDRIAAMHAELEKLGAQVESGPDYLRVHPLPASDWQSARIATYDDHRIAMCFSLAAFGPQPQTLLEPECVSKTFPDYFSVFHSLVQP